jgi:hypothetical protein
MSSQRGIGKKFKDRPAISKRLGSKADGSSEDSRPRRGSALPSNRNRANLVMAVQVFRIHEITGIAESDEHECVSLLKLKAALPVVVTKVPLFDVDLLA